MTDQSTPTVTIVVPARDEGDDLGRALAAVLDQEYPRDRVQVLVVDGASSDRTAEIAARALDGRGLLEGRVLSNPEATTPSNLNVGLAHAKGEYLCRVDARSIVPRHYVRRCVDTLGSRPDVAVVGGRQVTTPRDGRATSIGIARALNNRFLMGLSRYRRGARSGVTDTVYLGAFRVSQLRAVGGWDESLLTNQDFDLNRRMSRLGLVWFDHRLAVEYLPRTSIGALFAQYHRFGRWKVRYWTATGDRPRARQIVLLGAPLLASVAGACLWRRAPRARPVLVAGTVVAGAAFELLGTSEPRGSIRARAVGIVASAALAAGWLGGILTGVVERTVGGFRRA